MVSFFKKYSLACVFFAAVFATAIFDMLMPPRDFSELENRYLTKRPKLTFSSLAANTYTKKYEEFIGDQFVGRDNWISLKSLAETAFLKTESGGIVYGADGYLLEKFVSFPRDKLEKNIEYIEEFLRTNSFLPVTFALVPSSSDILAHKMPAGVPNVDQRAEIAEIYARMRAAGAVHTPDLGSALARESENDIYYKTDHHWTLAGALTGYRELSREFGILPHDFAGERPLSVPEFYGTYHSKATPLVVRTDTIEYYNLPIKSVTVDGKPKEEWLDTEKFATKDKYAAFLWGNNGLTVLESSSQEAAGKILVIKDSYGNSMAPLFVHNYAEVYIVDLRAVGEEGIAGLLADNIFEEILVIYSFSNFVTDNNIFKLNF